MTSIPASLSARAITLAPRSWPSRPGFAITTRSLRISPFRERRSSSDDRNLFVFAPYVAQRVAQLTNRGVRPDGVENGRHQVVRAARGGAQRVERRLHPVVVARLFQRGELGELRVGGRIVEVQDFDWRLVLLYEVFDADDDLFLALEV